MKKRNKSKLVKILLLSLIGLLMAGGGGFYIWSQQTYSASAEMVALVGEENIRLEKDWVIFTPEQEVSETGLILYPGAKVEPEAYSYIGQGLAKRGYTVIIPNVLLNFAFFDVNKADEIRKAYPDIKSWYIGGHSLGGVAAASYAYKHEGQLGGLFFLGSYPADSNDFSDMSLPILSIYGERDGLTTVDKIDATRQLLPPNAVLHEIAGGNHAQFGMYGPQKGDRKAAISQEEQQDRIVKTIGDWLDSHARLFD